MTKAPFFDPNLGESTKNPALLDAQLPPFLIPPVQAKIPSVDKIRTLKGFISKAVQETKDTWTLHIFVGEADRRYEAGQFVSISPKQFPEIENFVTYFEKVKGKKELVRAYSLASSPHEPYISITTKAEKYEEGETEYPPVLSPLLASPLLVGREITFLGYTGAYILKEEMAQTAEQVLHLCAGSGIVPNFSLLKDQLHNNKNPHLHHILIDVNRHFDDIIYRTELEELAKAYPKRFQLLHLLTREEHPNRYGSHFFKGRPTQDFVQRLIKDPNKVLVYACGAGITKWQRQKASQTGNAPQPRFLETVGEIVTALGIDRKRFKREVYG